MKKYIALILIFTSAILSCRENITPVDILSNTDRTNIKILDYRMVDNQVVTIVINETALMENVEFNREKLDYSTTASIFTITLPCKLKKGESATLSFTLRKTNGNITRASLLLTAINPDIPSMLINEVSVKGNSTNPDRIELVALEDGNVQSMVLADGLEDNMKHSYTLPDLDVQQGDILVIYWDSTKKLDDKERDNTKMTYYLNAKSPSTLISTNGMLVLYKFNGGEIMDALVYSNATEDDYSGYGSEKLENAVNTLIEKEAWIGNTVDSSYVTSSRVLARLPGYVDSDTSEDWFTTEARKSTFGEENTYSPYNEE